MRRSERKILKMPLLGAKVLLAALDRLEQLPKKFGHTREKRNEVR